MSKLVKGVYDELLTDALRAEIAELPQNLKPGYETLAPADAIEYLARKIAERARKHLMSTLSEDAPDSTLAEANRILHEVSREGLVDRTILQSIHDAVVQKPAFPLIPLSQSALVTNEQALNYHSVLRSELASADQVDFICPFIGNQGLNLIFDLLVSFGERLRIITTTYLGATNQRALVRLASTGAQVKIVYERSDQKTGLHAKAWVFHRNSGFTTATLGSSNLSPNALVDGLEWNVRLSSRDAPQVLQELCVTFERLWQDSRYEVFDPTRDAEKLNRALRSQRPGGERVAFFADVFPFPHQEEALSELAYARLEGKDENLIVAATGTGKTLLAAFDYSRLCREMKGRPKLLFVAHREEILRQSKGAFQAVLRDSDFGELNVSNERATIWKHVFASIQSMSNRNLSEFSSEHFDIIIVDEFHHAEANTYLALLNHFKPKQLLGLTATPERSDGKNVVERFGSPTYELRLWHALDRQLLCPFHYFGINDDTDLSTLGWSAGRYSDIDLEREFVDRGQDRANLVLRELLEKVEDVDRMRVVAFCATIRHAKFMAECFQRAGLRARALHSGVSREIRDQLMSEFRNGDLAIICTVDLFNEGVDIPEINTVLFLRPTESATVFVQQLGRGLRNHHNKGALTVLDFVGQQNRKFRMDLRFRSITGLSRTELEKAINREFPSLPPGCHIRLDRTTQSRVLQNLREAIPTGTKALVEELRRMSAAGLEIGLRTFLAETGLEPSDLYRAGRCFASIKKAAGMLQGEVGQSARAGAFLHIDDRRRCSNYKDALTVGNEDVRFERMMAFTLTGNTSLELLDAHAREELIELIEALNLSARALPPVDVDLPFCLHAHYSRDEIVGPFRDNPASMRQGTFYVKALQLDVHIVTLRKSERSFSPTTRYADYFIALDKLHWEGQSTTSATSDTGQRLINGTSRHLFFVREDKEQEGRTAPFMCLGFGRPVFSEGEKPIRLVWQLEHRVPDHIYGQFLAAAG